MSGGMAQLLAEKGIRLNWVAPFPFWTSLILSTSWPGKVKTFGMQTPMKRPGQPAGPQAVYVLLASAADLWPCTARSGATSAPN